MTIAANHHVIIPVKLRFALQVRTYEWSFKG
jgi:hypothetical protein